MKHLGMLSLLTHSKSGRWCIYFSIYTHVLVGTEKFCSTLIKLHVGAGTLGPQNSSSRGRMAMGKVCFSALLSSIVFFSFCVSAEVGTGTERWFPCFLFGSFVDL